MPTLVVSMPAFNTASFVEQAVRSVLDQKDVDLMLVVVDDGSTDETRAIVSAIDDPRLRLLRNDRNRGIPYCHNRVLRATTSAYVAHVDSDDWLLPGALRKMVDAMDANPRAGQAHSHFYQVTVDGSLDVRERRRQERWLREEREPDLDYRQALLETGAVINHLRVYRRSVFRDVGVFDERLRIDEDYEMALRIVQRHDIVLVPEFLYCMRVHDESVTSTLPWQAITYLRYRIAAWHSVWRREPDHFIRRRKALLARVVLEQVGRIMGLDRIASATLGPGRAGSVPAAAIGSGPIPVTRTEESRHGA